MKAVILNIGDELLIGQTLNTNAQWMSQRLNESGIDVIRHLSISDEKNDIVTSLNESLRSSQFIFITGGLGPTSDDITKHVLCEYFGGQLIFNEEAYRNIETIYQRRKLDITDNARTMSMVPDNCIVIPNSTGTAPGMIFTKEDKVIVSMPGVPYEMRAMIDKSVLPYLKEKFSLPAILHINIMTAGVGETVLSDRLKNFEKNKDPRVKLAYLPNVGKVRLRLTIKGSDKAELEKVINDAKEEVVAAISEFIYGFEEETLEKNVGDLLLEKKLQLGTAESCTGGYLSHLVTSVAGSSSYYKGSIVAYSNEIKENILKVNHETLETFGAVSSETVKEMITGALNVLNVDIVVAVSGVAGPSGGSPEKPVGTVFIGVGSKEKSVVKKISFTNNRERNIQLSGVISLLMLRKFLLQQLND